MAKNNARAPSAERVTVRVPKMAASVRVGSRFRQKNNLNEFIIKVREVDDDSGGDPVVRSDVEGTGNASVSMRLSQLRENYTEVKGR